MSKKIWFYSFIMLALPYIGFAQGCNALYQTGRTAVRAAKWDTAYIHFDIARGCFREKQNWEKYATCGRGMSFARSNQERDDEIPQFLLPMIDTLKKYAHHTEKYRSLVARIYRSAGGVYTKLENPDAAIDCMSKSLELEDDIVNKITIYTNLGVVYEDKLDYEKSIHYHSKALDILSDTFTIEGKTLLKISTLNNVGQAYRRHKRYEDALQKLEEGLQLLKDFQPQNDKEKEDKKSLKVRYYSNLGVLYTDWEKGYGDRHWTISNKHLSKRFLLLMIQHGIKILIYKAFIMYGLYLSP